MPENENERKTIMIVMNNNILIVIMMIIIIISSSSSSNIVVFVVVLVVLAVVILLLFNNSSISISIMTKQVDNGRNHATNDIIITCMIIIISFEEGKKKSWSGENTIEKVEGERIQP